MSRILRRPMFRGGRVDSRGTGITSGLGYAKGGSVNTPKRGLVDGPGGYSGYSLAWNLLKAAGRPVVKNGGKGFDWLFRPQGFISKNSGKLMNEGYGHGKFATNRLSQGLSKGLGSIKQGLVGAKNFLLKDPLVAGTAGTVKGGAKGIWGLRGKLPTIGAGVLATHKDLIPGKYSSEGWIGDTGDWIKEQWDEYSPFGDEKAGGREFVGDELEIVGDPRDLPTEKALTADQVKLMEMENLYKKLMEDTKKAAEGDEESIDIDKEKFAKALGSDKARGEDISNMLMSFAGKALKEGATTKSAFGEFFEEESKRPSSKTKIDQAAAQLAINKYIKGEMTKKEAETYLKRLELQYSMQTEGKKKSIGEFYLASDAPSFAGKVKDSVIAAYGQEGMVPDFEVTTSKKMEEDFEFGDKDVGVIFIETDTKKAYTFNSQGQPVPVLSG